MGIWQKTLFYLGLVDEDDPGSYAGAASTQAPAGRQAPPVARRQQGTGEQPVARRTPTVQRRSIDAPPEGGGDVAVRRPPQQQRQPLPPQGSQGVQGRRVEPPLSGRRRSVSDGAVGEAGVVIRPADSPLVRTVTGDDLESEVIVATSYSDAQLLADHIRATIPVVLDLRKVEPAMVRRLVDFASGLTYALGGSMRKIGQGVILVTPANVNLSRDERRRLRELGYYQAPEEG
jgi:cell division inhibitor SepF